MENEIKILEARIEKMQAQYDNDDTIYGRYHGRKSDLLCDITMKKIKLEKLKKAKTLAWRNRTIKYLAKVNFQ
jgi:hypothetical protein